MGFWKAPKKENINKQPATKFNPEKKSFWGFLRRKNKPLGLGLNMMPPAQHAKQQPRMGPYRTPPLKANPYIDKSDLIRKYLTGQIGRLYHPSSKSTGNTILARRRLR